MKDTGRMWGMGQNLVDEVGDKVIEEVITNEDVEPSRCIFNRRFGPRGERCGRPRRGVQIGNDVVDQSSKEDGGGFDYGTDIEHFFGAEDEESNLFDSEDSPRGAE